MLELSCRFEGRKLAIALADDASLRDLHEALHKETGIEPEGQKLLLRGAKLDPPQGELAAACSLSSLGVRSGARVMVVGTKLDVLEATKQSLRSAEEQAVARADAAQAARLKRYRGGRAGEPEPEYRFLKLTVLEGPQPDARGRIRELNSPPPSEAMELLRRLATDIGVLGIMAKHKWKVGLLKEFPPADGKVGVDDQCLLGYNKNKGMEIGLRLRTDGLDGLRPFEVIMRTLLHELTHMVHSEHDIAFRELNSTLTKERFALDWTRHGGNVADGGYTDATEVWETEEEARSVFTGGVGEAGGTLPRPGDADDPRTLALRAARRRQQAAAAAEAAIGSVVSLPGSADELGAGGGLPWEVEAQLEVTGGEALPASDGGEPVGPPVVAIEDRPMATGQELEQQPQHDVPHAATAAVEAPAEQAAEPMEMDSPEPLTAADISPSPPPPVPANTDEITVTASAAAAAAAAAESATAAAVDDPVALAELEMARSEFEGPAERRVREAIETLTGFNTVRTLHNRLTRAQPCPLCRRWALLVHAC